MSACLAEDVICTAQQAEVRNVGREGRSVQVQVLRPIASTRKVA